MVVQGWNSLLAQPDDFSNLASLKRLMRRTNDLIYDPQLLSVVCVNTPNVFCLCFQRNVATALQVSLLP